MIPVFKTPLVLLLIPIFLTGFWFYQRHQLKPSFQFSSIALLKGMPGTWRLQLMLVPMVLRILAVVVMLIALAGPQRVLEQAQVETEGIDIMLTLDVSGSMAAEDFQIKGQRMNRLEIIKQVVADFVRERPHDRLGLIAFGARAYTVCPLTTDHGWLLNNLERIHLGIVEDGTAIGSGISSALIRLKKSKAKSKVIILLTDGVSNTGTIAPLAAAQMAQDLKVKIYTIGAGTKGLAPFPVVDFFGRRGYQQVQIDIDETSLQQMAQLTGGQYFRATDTDSLRQIYRQIDALEKTKIEEKGYKEYTPLFGYFVALALMLLLVEMMLSNTVLLKIP